MGIRVVQAAISSLFVLAAPMSGLAAETALQSTMRMACGKPGGARFEKGVIPDSKSAALVAVQILNAIYGAKNIANQLPLNVDEHADRYVISGVPPKNYVGGNATIVLCRSNGAVLYLSHSK
jgi:phosphoribosylcarboxyaminoimidazole (NCAIR) mutase